jgi:hypothetical protein
VALALGGVILLAIICVNWYGWVSVPSDALIPVHWGGTWGSFVSKRAGLTVYLVVGVGLYLVLAALNIGGAARARSARPVLDVVLPIVLCALLITQVAAIRVARRRSGV